MGERQIEREKEGGERETERQRGRERMKQATAPKHPSIWWKLSLNLGLTHHKAVYFLGELFRLLS